MADNASKIEELYAAFAKGDVPTVLAAFAPDIEWNEAEHVTFWPGRGFKGVDEVVSGVFGRIPETFGDTFRIELLRVTNAGSTVLAEARYHGIVQATGEELDAQVAHVWDFEGDQIVRFQQYTDTWQFAEKTGQQPVTA